jgi:hypothetical protein
LNIVQVLSEKNVFKLDAEFEIFKSAASFSVHFDFMCCLRYENGNLKKNALSKIESLSYADFKHNFESNIVRVLSEKNIFKLDAEFEIFKSAAHFSVYFDFMRCLRHENGNLKKNAFSKIESLCHADSKHF